MLFSPLFVHAFLDYRYRPAAGIVPLVVMGYLFHALFSLFDFSLLQAKRTTSVFIISLAAFALNLALNFAMISRWGMYGAAWATTIAYSVEAAGAFLLARRFFPLPWRVPEILAGLAVASGALWLTQSAWMPKRHGVLLAVSAAFRIADSKFFLLNGIHLGMAVFDVELTQHCIASHHCRETNPIMPSSHAGQLSVSLGLVAYGSGMSYWLRKRRSKLWWLPPAAGAAAHTAGVATGFEHQ